MPQPPEQPITESSASNARKNDQSEKELEFLGKEYDTLRSEIIARGGTRAQLVLAALTLLTLSGTIVPFLLSRTSNSQIIISAPYIVATLLIVAFLFITLAWAFTQQDLEVAFLAKRIQSIRTRICSLLGQNANLSEIFKWDREHVTMLFPPSLLGRMSSLMLTLSGYLSVLVPAIIALVFATSIYIPLVSSFSPNTNWFICIGEIIDIAYLISNLLGMIYSMMFYRTLG